MVDLMATSSVLPEPLLNALVKTLLGATVCRPDAVLESSVMAVSTDSRAHHSSLLQWERTLETALLLEEHGLLVLHVTPKVIWARPQTVLRVIERHHLERWGRPWPAELRLSTVGTSDGWR